MVDLIWPALLMLAVGAAGAEPLDTVVLGSPDSERAHHLLADRSGTIAGGLGEPARRLLPRQPVDWQGGELTVTLRVDPQRPTYLTVKLWGDDVSENRVYVYLDRKQVGYRHLGDIEPLDLGSEEPGYNGRWYYRTTPLPYNLTRGRSELALNLRSTGRIWGYGQTFAQYQKAMTEPTRGLYRLYTHTAACFTPGADERQGAAPASPPVRSSPGPEALEQIQARVSREVTGLLTGTKALNQMQMQFLARAWHVRWTPAYHSTALVQRVVGSLDALHTAWQQNPKLAQSDPATWNADWFGFGPAGDAVRLLAEAMAPQLDAERRQRWAAMFGASVEWHRRHRRMYTNQSMIIDLNVYLANRALRVLAPDQALPEAVVLDYLYQSVGLRPWLGSETDHGPEQPVGEHYLELTAKGLTRELGYVGYYGEVLDWVCQLYDATRPAWGKPGDARLAEQLRKIAQARAVFRYPMLDADGYRAMRVETVVGWRDDHFPGDVAYGQRCSWDGTPLQTAAILGTPEAVGTAQQMLADGQYFAALARHMNERGFRVTCGLLEEPDRYASVRAQPPSTVRLPMTPGAPDFVFSDEEDGVVAVKFGDEVFYASLYWRARFGLNNLAKVHWLSPRLSRVAVVHEETQFEPSGLTYTRPDWTNLAFVPWGPRYPGAWHSAHAGETMPIARIPSGVPFKPGQESVYAGKGDFYQLHYGPWLIGMNLNGDRSFTLRAPAGLRQAKQLPTGRLVRFDQPLPVQPLSTVVLWLGE